MIVLETVYLLVFCLLAHVFTVLAAVLLLPLWAARIGWFRATRFFDALLEKYQTKKT